MSLNTIDLPNMKFGIYKGKSTCPRMTGIYVEMLPVIWTLLNGFSFKKNRVTEKKNWEKNCLQLKCKQQLSWAYFKMFDQTYY